MIRLITKWSTWLANKWDDDGPFLWHLPRSLTAVSTFGLRIPQAPFTICTFLINVIAVGTTSPFSTLFFFSLCLVPCMQTRWSMFYVLNASLGTWLPHPNKLTPPVGFSSLVAIIIAVSSVHLQVTKKKHKKTKTARRNSKKKNYLNKFKQRKTEIT